MKAEDVFVVRGRGNVFVTTVDVEVAHKGASLRRVRDGRVWPIRAVERFVKFVGQPTLGVGENVGFLMPDDCDLARGDEIEVVPAVPQSSEER